MMDSQYDFKDLSKYDSNLVAAAVLICETLNIYRNKVSDDEIKIILIAEKMFQKVSDNEQWGGDKYVGSIDSANANI